MVMSKEAALPPIDVRAIGEISEGRRARDRRELDDLLNRLREREKKAPVVE